MLIPSIDLMGGKAVQLVRGRKKALEVDAFEMLAKFRGFPAIQVIDLDAAMGKGNNHKILKRLAKGTLVEVAGADDVESGRLQALGDESGIVCWCREEPGFV